MSTQETKKPAMTALLGALQFAARKHCKHRRKSSDAPYINHLIAVAELLARVGRVTDLATLQAEILHDSIEDTQTTPQELDDLFGQEVRLLVQEVTDDKSLPKEERKQLQIDGARALSTRAKQIRIADKINNVGDMPADWPLQQMHDYLAWAEKVVAGCRGCNPELEHQFDLF